jgi:thiol:disulfide interchange protein DsbC
MKSIAYIALAFFVSISAAQADTASVRAAMQKKFPKEKIIEVVKTPYGGLYEVAFEDSIVYTDEKTDFLLSGSLYDMKTMQNLTEARAKKLYAVKFDSLPFQYAFKEVKGDGKRKVAIFTDPNCPFCKRLEKEMQKVNNVTIYRFILAILPGSPEKAKDIWCSPNRDKIWRDALLEGKNPPKAKACDTSALKKVAQLAARLRINGTPAIIFADGSINPGYMPADDIEKELSSAKAD